MVFGQTGLVGEHQVILAGGCNAHNAGLSVYMVYCAENNRRGQASAQLASMLILLLGVDNNSAAAHNIALQYHVITCYCLMLAYQYAQR